MKWKKLLKKFVADFWPLFKRNKMGIAGTILLLAFLFISLAAPLLTPYDPIYDNFIADSYAYPEWFSLCPQYSNLPRNFELNSDPSTSWLKTSIEHVEVSLQSPLLVLEYTSDTAVREEANLLVLEFNYTNSPPKTFKVKFTFSVPVVEKINYNVELVVESPSGKKYQVWDIAYMLRQTPYPPYTDKNITGNRVVNFNSNAVPYDYKIDVLKMEWFDTIANKIFVEKGSYRLWFNLIFRGKVGGTPHLLFKIGSVRFEVLGLLFGPLGTDHVGSDLFTQLVYGTRVSFVIGILASFSAVSIGLVVGVISGYFGGAIDEALMRVVDLLLVIPLLPLLMVFTSILGRSIWNIILMIAILGWSGFARMVRSQVLQIKNATFVEAAKAAGASEIYIVFKHILPNVIPLAVASTILRIPAAIILEASLSFLNLGDPRTPSWGRTLQYAFHFGAFSNLSWWWILPPGICISLLGLAFVFIGYTVEEIVSPRLRIRK